MRDGIIESANVDILSIFLLSPTNVDTFGLMKPKKTLRTFDAYGWTIFQKLIRKSNDEW